MRPIDPASDAEVDLVATRMRETLMEVLGEARGDAMYTLDWLRNRVRQHLDPQQYTGGVFVAQSAGGDIVGHTIVRIEHPDSGPDFGLFSTVFVAAQARRARVASRLIAHGEAWMAHHALSEAATVTSPTNAKLITLFEGFGYTVAPVNDDFVRLSKRLG